MELLFNLTGFLVLSFICLIVSYSSYISGMNYGRDNHGWAQGFDDGWNACMKSLEENDSTNNNLDEV